MATDTLTHATAHAHEHGHHDAGGTKIFGFWIYLMSDCILFSILFATYAVLVNGTAGGPTGKDIFELPFVLVETFLLLFSSITYGMAAIAMYKNNKSQVISWLALTWLFGAGFIGMEIYEFHHLIVNGMGPDRSGFLSAFFALVGTHGLHVTSGLIWMAVLMVQIARRGLTSTNRTRIMCLSLFWHFLDVVWICVFTVVYLMGRCNESFYRSQRRVPWQRKNLHDRLYPVDHSDGDSVLDGDDRGCLSGRNSGNNPGNGSGTGSGASGVLPAHEYQIR